MLGTEERVLFKLTNEYCEKNPKDWEMCWYNFFKKHYSDVKSIVRFQIKSTDDSFCNDAYSYVWAKIVKKFTKGVCCEDIKKYVVYGASQYSKDFLFESAKKRDKNKVLFEQSTILNRTNDEFESKIVHNIASFSLIKQFFSKLDNIERKILKLKRKGYSQKDIAIKLYMSEGNVTKKIKKLKKIARELFML